MALRKNDVVAINQSVNEAAALIGEYQKAFGAVAHGGEEIKIHPQQSLYEALDQRGLLVK